MRHRIAPIFIIAFVLAASTQGLAQAATLEGQVTDAVRGSAIPAASVTVTDAAGHVVGHKVTGANGHYTVDQLPLGAHLKAAYERGGYSPRPRVHEVQLASASTTQDVQLIFDTEDQLYWKDWSTMVKTRVEARSVNADDRTKMYEDAWSRLGALGISTDAQVQAAKQLTTVAPDSIRSKQISHFASVDTTQLHQHESEVHSAFEGKTKLQPSSSLPPDVVAEVAATELKKGEAAKPNKDEFLKNYRETWGESGVKQLQEKELNKSKAATLPAIGPR